MRHKAEIYKAQFSTKGHFNVFKKFKGSKDSKGKGRGEERREGLPSRTHNSLTLTVTVGGPASPTLATTSSHVSTLASPSQTSAFKLLTVALLLNCPFNLFAKLGLRIRCFGGRRSWRGTLRECGWSFGRAATAKMPSRLRGEGRAGSVGERERVGGWRQQMSAAGIVGA